MKSMSRDKTSIEELLARADAIFTEIGEVRIPEIKSALDDIQSRCDIGFEALEMVHKRLGLFEKAEK